VLVLLAPSLRSGGLLQRLSEAGFAADLCLDPDQVIRRLRRKGSYQAIVCDNLQPTCHLQRLFHRLERSGDVSLPPVVLASGGSRLPLTIQAREWGAAGAWTPPFLASDLHDLIAGPGD
jgi:DNA-binding NtrC family response regulator